ncbi:MAG: RNA polymerase sigma factor [Sphingobacteriales bacterium]|nr:RNA polymerase sigma factor [Sphingobacteriales bacterium]
MSNRITIPNKEDIKQLNDRQLIDRIISSGDTALFSVLYDRYANKVYRKCIGMVRNKDDAQDLAHDILVKAFLNISNFEGNSTFSTWIYAISYNQCIDFLRQRQKLPTNDYEESDNLLNYQDDDTQIAEKELFEMGVERLNLLIYQLSEDDRAILLMKYQDGMSIDNIILVLNVTESAVKMRLKRDRERLRKRNEKLFGKS